LLFVLTKVCRLRHREELLSLSDSLRTSVLWADADRRAKSGLVGWVVHLRRTLVLWMNRQMWYLTGWSQTSVGRTTPRTVISYHRLTRLTNSASSSRHRANNGSVTLVAHSRCHYINVAAGPLKVRGRKLQFLPRDATPRLCRSKSSVRGCPSVRCCHWCL